MAEKVDALDFPLYRELDDLIDDPEARIGVGEGATLSQGEEPVTLASYAHQTYENYKSTHKNPSSIFQASQ